MRGWRWGMVGRARALARAQGEGSSGRGGAQGGRPTMEGMEGTKGSIQPRPPRKHRKENVSTPSLFVKSFPRGIENTPLSPPSPLSPGRKELFHDENGAARVAIVAIVALK